MKEFQSKSDLSWWKEIEGKPIPLEVKLFSTNGQLYATGGKDLYWEYYYELKHLVETVYGSDVHDWLDLTAIPVSTEGGVVLLCVDTHGKLRGFTHGHPERLNNGKEGLTKWVLSTIATHPPGSGVGGMLFEAIKKEAKMHGAEVLFPRTDPSRLKSIRFFLSHGCEIVGRVENYYRYETGRAPTVWLMVDLTKEDI